jgi:preprotein translocase subunit SecD
MPPHGISLTFANKKTAKQAQTLLTHRFHDYAFHTLRYRGQWVINAIMPQAAMTKITDYTIDQAMSILRNRVNELGVSEAVVQRQGKHHISVDLPGIQDTARAKELIGKTASLRFQLADTKHDVTAALNGAVPANSRIYYDEHKRPVLLKNDIILKGSAITYAIALFREGRAAVNIRLGGGGESLFHRITAEHIGQPLAVIYTEIKPEKKLINGKTITIHKKHERVISLATIQSALGNNFDITGLHNLKYAQNLALLLRSGALAAPVDIIEELTIGPSLGKANIDKGIYSLLIGSLIVIVFMALYYRLFGLVADLALLLNIVFIMAILSILGATLTLPGIAGIVLTVGMAVDANVLINERIREELRHGMSALASIQAGYDKAFSTIVDANVTTLIVAVVLFSLGSGSVKGFAITLIIGLLASMITSIFFTRAVINLIYNARHKKAPKKISIGI